MFGIKRALLPLALLGVLTSSFAWGAEPASPKLITTRRVSAVSRFPVIRAGLVKAEMPSADGSPHGTTTLEHAYLPSGQARSNISAFFDPEVNPPVSVGPKILPAEEAATLGLIPKSQATKTGRVPAVAIQVLVKAPGGYSEEGHRHAFGFAQAARKHDGSLEASRELAAVAGVPNGKYVGHKWLSWAEAEQRGLVPKHKAIGFRHSKDQETPSRVLCWVVEAYEPPQLVAGPGMPAQVAMAQPQLLH